VTYRPISGLAVPQATLLRRWPGSSVSSDLRQPPERGVMPVDSDRAVESLA
jgi:hypothetical protein